MYEDWALVREREPAGEGRAKQISVRLMEEILRAFAVAWRRRRRRRRRSRMQGVCMRRGEKKEQRFQQRKKAERTNWAGARENGRGRRSQPEARAYLNAEHHA